MSQLVWTGGTGVLGHFQDLTLAVGPRHRAKRRLGWVAPRLSAAVTATFGHEMVPMCPEMSCHVWNGCAVGPGPLSGPLEAVWQGLGAESGSKWQKFGQCGLFRGL